jgi:hypothetical protein
MTEPMTTNDQGGAPSTGDRWAHRRAEPRPFAALWLLYLVGVSALVVANAGVSGMLHRDVYRAAACGMLTLVGVGVIVVWPMLRLSQETPERPGRSVLADALIVALPSQAMVWAQALPWMGDWPVEVVGVIAAVLGAWTLITGAMLAGGLRHISSTPPGAPRGVRRAVWMALVLLAGVTLPAAGLLIEGRLGAPPRDGILWMGLSPVTGPFAIAGQRTWVSLGPPVNPVVWVGVAVLGLMGVAGWVLVGVWRGGATPARIN